MTILFRLMICLILAAATTIACAWVLAIVFNPGSAAQDHAIDILRGSKYNHMWARRWRARFSERVELHTLSFYSGPGDSEMAVEDVVSWWAQPRADAAVAAGTIPAGGAIRIESHGFPLPALEGAAFIPPGPAGVCMPAGGAILLDRDELILLPFIPHWPGCAIDVVFFTVFWGALWFLALRVRALYRCARNRCAGCAYDLRGNPESAACPECGRQRRACSAAQ